MEKEYSLGTIIGIILVAISFIMGIAFIVGWIIGVVWIASCIMEYNFSYITYVLSISIILLILGCFIKPIRLLSSYFMMMWSCSTMLGSFYYLMIGDISLLSLSLLLSSLVLYIIDSRKIDKYIKDKDAKGSEIKG